MSSSLISVAYDLVGRALPHLLALQDAVRTSGGGGGGPAPSGGGGGPAGAQGPAGMANLLIPVAMIAFLYLFMIRPAQKQRKDQETLQKGLLKGDKVVTTSGIVGTVTGTDEQFITLEISEKVRVKFLRDAVTRKLGAESTGKTNERTSSSEAKK
jgi:preprotein translocase subunit YajC